MAICILKQLKLRRAPTVRSFITECGTMLNNCEYAYIQDTADLAIFLGPCKFIILIMTSNDRHLQSTQKHNQTLHLNNICQDPFSTRSCCVTVRLE